MMQRTIMLSCASLLALESAAYAQNKGWYKEGMDGRKIMEAVEYRADGDDVVATVTLEHRAEKGEPRLRRMTLMRKEYPDQTKWVTYFQAPADVRNMAFLVWDMKSEADRRWIWLPGVNQLRRMSVGDERKSFFGTDFVYDDITIRDPEQDEHKVIGVQKHKDWECIVVEQTPKNRAHVEFARMRSWVWKDEPMILKQELFDDSGTLFKQGTVESLQQIQGIWTMVTSMMTNIKDKTHTKLVAENIKYNTKLQDVAFTEAQLPRGVPK